MGDTVNIATSLLLSLCDTFVTAYTYNKLLRNKNKKATVLLVFVLYLVTVIKTFQVSSNTPDIVVILFAVLPILILVFLLRMLYKQQLLNAVVFCIMYYFYVVVVQLIAYCITYIPNAYIWHLSTSDDCFLWVAQIIYMVVAVLFVRRCHGLMERVYLKVVKYVTSASGKFIKNIRLWISIFLFISLVVLGIQVFLNMGANNTMGMFAALALLTVFCILFLAYYETILHDYKAAEASARAREIEERNRMNFIHNEFVSSMNKFGHSYNNMMQTIDFMLADENVDFESIRPVLSDLVKWSEKNKINYKMRFVNIPNMIVASILSIKVGRAEELGVHIIVNYTGKSAVDVQSKDFIDILNILIDNAVEAAYYTDDKQVRIDLAFKEDEFLMDIENSYKRDEAGHVMKYGESRQIGLENIRDITNVNENIEFSVNMLDNIFKARLKISNKKISGAGNE